MGEVIELNDVAVSLVNPNDMPKHWEKLEPLIKDGCKWSAGQLDVISVVDGILDGRFQLAAFHQRGSIQSILLLTISQFPTGRRLLEVLLASGTAMKDWMKLEDQMLTYAREMGCSGVRMIGREGLQKMLPEWKRTAIVLEREV